MMTRQAAKSTSKTAWKPIRKKGDRPNLVATISHTAARAALRKLREDALNRSRVRVHVCTLAQTCSMQRVVASSRPQVYHIGRSSWTSAINSLLPTSLVGESPHPALARTPCPSKGCDAHVVSLDCVAGGMYHTGVEVWGREYWYGYSETEGYGVSSCVPRANPDHRYYKTIECGISSICPSEARSRRLRLLLTVLCIYRTKLLHFGSFDCLCHLVQLAQLVRQLELSWSGPDYDVLSRNCCHFTQELCTRLGVGPAPEWLNLLAETVKRIGLDRPGWRTSAVSS